MHFNGKTSERFGDLRTGKLTALVRGRAHRRDPPLRS
jgi:hypothetical protein